MDGKKFDQDTASVCQWREEAGVIHLKVVSDGTGGDRWIGRLGRKGIKVGRCVSEHLHSNRFEPTSGIEVEVVILRGSFFKDEDRTTENINVEAQRRGWVEPISDAACLIRWLVTDEEIEAMGLQAIVSMRGPLSVDGFDPCYLGADRREGSFLQGFLAQPKEWLPGDGFAYVLPHQ
jgi:hypothetical protein